MAEATSKKEFTLKFRLVHVVLVLLLLSNITTIALWKPWQSNTSSTRKITVSGEATLKETPDEYTITPYFEFAASDKSKATADLTAKSNTITAKLKELGVADEQIKSSTSGYEKYSVSQSGEDVLQLYYTITLSTKDMAQKVQDYLITQNPKGQISPQAAFSVQKRRELEDKARSQAIDDAKAKAEKTAKQLNAKLGKAVNISDGAGYGGVPVPMSATMEARDSAATSSIPVQPGQDSFSFSVSVEYELK